MNVSIILPTYLERKNITHLISEIFKRVKNHKEYEVDIVVVDDNSPDGTAAVCRRRFRQRKNVSVYVRTKARSLAASIGYGISRSRGDYVLVMDTDFNHDPRTIPTLLKYLRRYDMVIGSRFIKGGGMESKLRYISSKTYNRLLRMLFRTNCSDYLSGFFCMKKEDLNRMDTHEIFRGYGEYFIRLLSAANRNHLRLKEIPVYYRNRMYGSSKSKFFKMLIMYSHTALNEWLKALVYQG